MILNKKTAIMKLSTFAPVGRDDTIFLNGTVFEEFLDTARASFDHFREQGFTELIFDVSGNGYASML